MQGDKPIREIRNGNVGRIAGVRTRPKGDNYRADKSNITLASTQGKRFPQTPSVSKLTRVNGQQVYTTRSSRVLPGGGKQMMSSQRIYQTYPSALNKKMARACFGDYC